MLAWVKAALCQHSLDSRTWLWPSSVKISPQLLKNVISQPFYFLGCLDRCIFYLLWSQKAINKSWSSIIHSNKYVIHKSIGVVVCVTFFCTNAFQCLWLHQLLTNSEFFSSSVSQNWYASDLIQTDIWFMYVVRCHMSKTWMLRSPLEGKTHRRKKNNNSVLETIKQCSNNKRGWIL